MKKMRIDASVEESYLISLKRRLLGIKNLGEETIENLDQLKVVAIEMKQALLSSRLTSVRGLFDRLWSAIKLTQATSVYFTQRGAEMWATAK